MYPLSRAYRVFVVHSFSIPVQPAFLVPAIVTAVTLCELLRLSSQLSKYNLHRGHNNSLKRFLCYRIMLLAES